MRDYNPSAWIDPKPIAIPDKYCRRIIIIDGMNVFYCFPGSKSNKNYDAAGLLLTIYEFLCQGYEVMAVAKDHTKGDCYNENTFIFDELEKMEILTFIPKDAADNSIDDRVILHWATEYGAAVVSRDKFVDHEKTWPDAVKRRIGFDFDFKQISLDKFHLEENRFKFSKLSLLNANGKPFKFDCADSNVALCGPSDPDHEKVFKTYRQISPKYFEARLRKCAMIADFLQLKKCQSWMSANNVKLPTFDYCRNTHLLDRDIQFKDFYETFKWCYDDGKRSEYE